MGGVKNLLQWYNHIFVKEYEYLGHMLDSSLNLCTNFNRAYKRASSRMKLLQNYLNTRAATKIYNLEQRSLLEIITSIVSRIILNDKTIYSSKNALKNKQIVKCLTVILICKAMKG